MNRSTGQGHAVHAPGLLSYARRLLHAFAEAGQPSAAGPQLFLGPNGGLMWTDGPHVDRSEKYPGTVFPEKSAPAPVDAESPEVVCPRSQLEAPRTRLSRLLRLTRHWESPDQDTLSPLSRCYLAD